MSSNSEQDDQSQGYTGYRGYTANQQQSQQQQRRPYGYSPDQEQQAQDFGYGTGTYSGGQQQQQQQQSGTQGKGAYQPPRSAARGTMPVETTSTGLNARTEALLSYLFGWVSGLVFFVIERKNKYVRFHAIQSFLYFGSLAIILGIFKFLGAILGSIFLIGFVLGFIFNIAVFLIGFIVFVSWVYLMVQAYRGKKPKVPFFGDFAERFSR
ncbi:MAG TPA: hypothetical protein VKR42_09435 [Ktedonobacteraceae bacterium]|nr:hypothetical protein [Ktedonobacteraceae bacterium]